MPKNISTKISDLLTRHSIDLMRLDAGLRRKVIAQINGLEQALIRKLNNFPISEEIITRQRLRNLDKLLTLENSVIEKVYRDIFTSMQSDLSNLAHSESIKIAKVNNSAITVNLMKGELSTNKIKQLVSGKSLVLGKQMDKLWLDASAGLKDDFERVMRQGIINNDTIPQLVQRVRGTRAGGFRDGIMQAKRNQAARLVRTSAFTITNNTREAVYQQNKDILNGRQWLSTLDSRTSDICKALDGQAWDFKNEPIAPSVSGWQGAPPAHINCRSTMISVLKSWEQLSKSKNKDIKKALKKKRPSKNIRTSMDGGVSADLNYEEWLRIKDKADPEFAKKVLGQTKYRLWKDGKLSFTDLIDQSHNPLTSEQLLAKTAGREAIKTLEKEAVAKKVSSTKIIEKTIAKKKAITPTRPPERKINLNVKKASLAQIEAELLNTKAFYKGLPSELANGFNQAINDFRNRYPLFKKFGFFVGDGKPAIEEMLKQRAIKVLEKSKLEGTYSRLVDKTKRDLVKLANDPARNRFSDRLVEASDRSPAARKALLKDMEKRPDFYEARRLAVKYPNIDDIPISELEEYHILTFTRQKSAFGTSSGAIASTYENAILFDQVMVRTYPKIKNKARIQNHQRMAKSNWSPKSTFKDHDTATFRHELGHNLDFLILKSKYKKEWRQWLRDYLTEQSKLGNFRREQISRYSDTDMFETVAEAFSDFYSSGETNFMSKAIIDKANQFYKLIETGV